MMLYAGVLTAVRTPFVRERGAALGFAGHCALRLAIVTALALPLLAWLTEVSVDASLSVLGVDAFDAGIELHGQLGMALLLGALWGAGAGAAGALLACASGAAGRRAAALAQGDAEGPTEWAGQTRPVEPAAPPYAESPEQPGPYSPAPSYRPANPDTNPYLHLPDGLRETEDGRRPPDARSPDARPPGARPPGARPPENGRPPDVYGAPTVAGPYTPPPAPKPRSQRGPSQDGPPPPPEEPPPPPRRPRGRP
jgi:hypothetical protein